MIANNLRKATIKAALQGELTKKQKDDLDVLNLVSLIKNEREERIKNKQLRRRKLKGTIMKEDIPYNIPSHWTYIRLGELGEFRKGPFGSALTKSIFVKDSVNSVKVYEQKNAINKSTDLGDYFITKEYYENKMMGFTVKSGDIIISCAGTIGETFVFPSNTRIGIINQALMRVRTSTGIDKSFFKYLFEYILNSKGEKKGKGSAIKNIPPFDILLNFVLGLPPLAEQKRIVDKLDMILPMIDALEKDENKLDLLMKNYPNKMRKSLLQAALEGKLTNQHPEDGSGFDLYRDIVSIRNDMIFKKVIKKDTKLLPISDFDIPFDIPDTWKWVRFGEIVNYQMGKTPPRGEGKYWSKQDFPWVSIKDMPSDGIVESTNEFVSKEAIKDKFRNRVSKKGTLLMSFKLTVGRVSILGFDAVHNEAIISIYPIKHKDTIQDFLFKILPYISNWGNTKSAIKGKTLNSTSISNLMIPLPPLTEQKRIVEKLDKLLPLLDSL